MRQTWPAVIACVDCDGYDNPYRWDVVVLRRTDDGYCYQSALSGATPTAFWATIAQIQAMGEPTWVVSYGCTRVWSQLGVWERLESGQILACGRDVETRESMTLRLAQWASYATGCLRAVSAGSVSRMLDRESGCLVLEDPPNILQITLERDCKPITWIDARNWSIDFWPLGYGSEASSVALASAVKAYSELVRRLKLGGLKTTLGAQSLHGWRASYLGDSGVYCHDDPDALAIESAAYHGGRCECFRLGEIAEPIYHVDVRSMYPWVCATYELPCRLIGTSERKDTLLDAISAGHQVIADVTIESQSPSYPLLQDGIVIWPVGRYRTTLCGPELADAMYGECVREWHGGAMYLSASPLRDYAIALHDERCRLESVHDDVMAGVVKRLMVCLPGKLGQQEKRWATRPDIEPYQQYGEWYGTETDGVSSRYRAVAGICQQEMTGSPAAEANIAIAAWITSAARLRLLQLIRQTGWSNVVYCDTDSLMVNEAGYANLDRPDNSHDLRLGSLYTKAGPGRVTLRGIKDYTEGLHRVTSGLPRGITQDTGDGEHFWYSPSSGSQAARGKRPTAERRLLTYKRDSDYRHGVVDSEGVVTPHRIDE